MSPFFASRFRLAGIEKKVRASEQSVPLAAQPMVTKGLRDCLRSSRKGGVQVSNRK